MKHSGGSLRGRHYGWANKRCARSNFGFQAVPKSATGKLSAKDFDCWGYPNLGWLAKSMCILLTVYGCDSSETAPQNEKPWLKPQRLRIIPMFLNGGANGFRLSTIATKGFLVGGLRQSGASKT